MKTIAQFPLILQRSCKSRTIRLQASHPSSRRSLLLFLSLLRVLNQQIPVVESFSLSSPRHFRPQPAHYPLRNKDEAFSSAEEQNIALLSKEDLEALPDGIPRGFKIIQSFPVTRLDVSSVSEVSASDIQRLGLTHTNCTLPVALMIVDPTSFPTLSKARKACRKGTILIHKKDEESKRGRVADRIQIGDTICKQVRVGSGYFPVLNYKKPPFDLPCIYEDDHMALVDKPAGIVVYRQGHGGHGIMTVRAALPFTLTPPRVGTMSVMRRPASVHRLDKPTSGILVVAKTKPAMLDLSKQFQERRVKKTYMAVINGLPQEDSTAWVASKEAHAMGVDVDPNDEARWQLINSKLEDKDAVTLWRPLRYAKSLRAHDGYLTLVLIKPKTGRYHQIRRHMAWVGQRPLVGDSTYDEGTESAMHFRQSGLFLCSTQVSLDHPFYNALEGRELWKTDRDRIIQDYGNLIFEDLEGKVRLSARIDLPNKFSSLLDREQDRFERLSDQP